MIQLLHVTVVTMTALSPLLFVVVLLVLAAWRDRREAEETARQIRLTDAIAEEVGAVVAPVLKRRLGGWRVEIPAPLGRPAVMGRIVSETHRTLERLGSGRYEIVLTPQAPVSGFVVPRRPSEAQVSTRARLNVA
jgi:hypothetical protein